MSKIDFIKDILSPCHRSLFQINGKRGFAPKTFLNEYKVLRRDLSYEVPVYKFNDKINKVQSEKLESTEESSTLKDEFSQDDNKTPSLESIDESNIEESHAINADSISPPYEVIDGTTVYFESSPSVQPSFVSEVAQTTALPNEQASLAPDSKIAVDHEGLSSDKNIFINNKELQPDMNDASSKLEGIKLPVDTQKQTSSDVTSENPEAIISSTLDTVSKDDISALDENSKSKEELSENAEHTEKLDSSAEENVENNKKEKITEHVESDGIFASITKTFSILSNMEKIVAAENTVIQSSDDTAAPEVAAESNLQLEEQVPENIGIKATVTEKTLSPTQIKLESSVDQSFIDKEKVKTQQEIIRENIESAKISDEKIKEASTIILGNITSPSDVPLSNNFVRENADKPAKELPIAPPILTDNSSASVKADVDSHVENIKIQETSSTEKVTENIRTDDAVTHKEESTILSDLQETVATKTTSTQSSDDIEQKLAESETYLENVKKDADYKETIDQAGKIVIAEHSETISLPSLKETTENIATELFSENHSVGENIVITEEALNQSTTDIQFNKESIVYSNVNDNLINDTISDNVPIESNEFSNDVKSSILGPEQSIDSSQQSMISEETMTFNEVLKKRDLSNIEENLEHKDSKLIN